MARLVKLGEIHFAETPFASALAGLFHPPDRAPSPHRVSQPGHPVQECSILNSISLFSGTLCSNEDFCPTIGTSHRLGGFP